MFFGRYGSEATASFSTARVSDPSEAHRVLSGLDEYAYEALRVSASGFLLGAHRKICWRRQSA